MKLRTISCQEGTLTLHEGKKQDFSRPVSETSENVYLFVSLSQLVSFGVCSWTPSNNYSLELVKRISKLKYKLEKSTCHVNVL